MTGEMVTSGSINVGSIRFASQGTTDFGDRTIPDGDPIRSVRVNDEAPDGAHWTENGFDEVGSDPTVCPDSLVQTDFLGENTWK